MVNTDFSTPNQILINTVVFGIVKLKKKKNRPDVLYCLIKPFLMFSEDESEQSNSAFENSEKGTRTCAQPTLYEGTSQRNDDRDGPVKMTKEFKYPSSPHRISSITVYQKDGGSGFLHVEAKEKSPKEDENPSLSSDLKAKWFLSSNRWQDAIPLLTDDLGSLCNDENADVKQRPAYSDSSELSNFSAVHESLEKMRENHSLFYKIACDISISDSDITKSDGNSNGQMCCTPQEEEELLITESDNATCNTESSTQRSVSPRVNNNSNSETWNKDHSKQNSQLEVNGANLGGDADDSVQVTEEDQKRSDSEKESNSFSESAVSTVCEQGTNSSIFATSMHGGKSVIRRDSFGKARVTVLRTSL